jgi:hypothetical protein
MPQSIVKQLDCDLTPVAGLTLVARHLKTVQPVLGCLDAAQPVEGGVANSDIVRSHHGLQVRGKSDFDAIEKFRDDAGLHKQAPGIGLLPSARRCASSAWTRVLGSCSTSPRPIIETLLTGQRPDYGVLPCGWLPLGVHTFAMANGARPRKAWGRTCASADGCCPLAAYPGRHGYDLVCRFAALAMNILPLTGQSGLLGPDADRAIGRSGDRAIGRSGDRYAG